MIFANSNELSHFVEGLLKIKEEQALLMLENEDEKQLNYAKRNIIQKMPKELQPKNATASVQLSQGEVVTFFPSMFESVDRRTYEYINENIQNMRRIANNYSFPIEKQLSSRVKDSVIELQEHPQKIQEISEPALLIATPKEPIIGEKSQKSQKDVVSIRSIQSSSLGRPQNSPVRNPFVANNVNFTDKFANSKTLAQKYPHLSFTENSRNLTALAQTAKYSAFSQSVAFPTTVLAGTMLPPRDSTFSKETKLNVDDVMRYTLGVKRQKSEKTVIENPFMRAPKRRE